MTRWEYLVVQKQATGIWAASLSGLNLGWGTEPEMLAECGAQGWELASVAIVQGPGPDYYFKRPIT